MFCVLLCIIIVFIIIVIGLLLRRTCDAKSQALRIHRKMEGGGIVKYKHIRYLILAIKDNKGYYNYHHINAHGLHAISQDSVRVDFYYLRQDIVPSWFMHATFIKLMPYSEVWGRDNNYYRQIRIDDMLPRIPKSPLMMAASPLRYGSKMVDIVSIADPNVYPNQGDIVNIVDYTHRQLKASVIFKCKLSDMLVGGHENDKIGYKIVKRLINYNTWADVSSSTSIITEIAPTDMYKYSLITTGETAEYSRYKQSTPRGTGRWESDLSNAHSDGNMMVYSYIPSGPMAQKSQSIVEKIPPEAMPIYNKSIDPSQYNDVSPPELTMISNGSYDRNLDILDTAGINEKEDVSSVFSLPQDGKTVSLPPMPSNQNLFSYPNRQYNRYLRYILNSNESNKKDYFIWKAVNMPPPNPANAKETTAYLKEKMLEFIGNFVLHSTSSIIEASRNKYSLMMNIYYATELIRINTEMIRTTTEKILENVQILDKLKPLNEYYLTLLEKTRGYVSNIKPLLAEVTDEQRRLKFDYETSWRQIVTNIKRLVIIDPRISSEIDQFYQNIVKRAYQVVGIADSVMPNAEQLATNVRAVISSTSGAST